MLRSYYFEEKVAEIIYEEVKRNFCGVSVEGHGEEVAIIVACKRTRELLGEKGAGIRLLEHKVNFFFGSLEMA